MSLIRGGVCLTLLYVCATLNLESRVPAFADGDQALERVQIAVGVNGSTKLRALAMSGTVTATQMSGDRIERQLDIRALLPRHYLRIERWRRPDGTVTFLSGYSEGRLLTAVTTDSPNLDFGQPQDPSLLPRERREAALMLLGLVGVATEVVSVHDERNARGGKGSVPAKVQDREIVLHLDPKSIPIAITYTASVRLPSGGKSGTALPPPTSTEVRIAFDDRRPTNGLLLPYRITKSAAGHVLEQIDVVRYQVNPPLTTDDFRTSHEAEPTHRERSQ